MTRWLSQVSVVVWLAACGQARDAGSDAMTFSKVAASSTGTCALKSDHSLYCWGGNEAGELGDGSDVTHGLPERVGTDNDWVDIGMRTLEGCGLKSDHSMWCWGYGVNGELGNGVDQNVSTPTKVISDKPGVGWKAMSVGTYSVCGIHDDGSLACWGVRPPDKHASLPAAVGTDTDWIEVAAGEFKCGLRGPQAHLFCWGRSDTGGLGLGDTTRQDSPAQVGTDSWKHIAVGYDNACAIRSDSTLWCWGNGGDTRQTLQYGNVPMQIGVDADWQSVELSMLGAVGLRSGGAAYAWGVNDQGQLGATLGDNMVPTPLGDAIGSWSQISGGNFHSCGIAAGHAYCWGASADGTPGFTSTPMLVE